ncbi:MAG TPA: PKD domain-containing protein, partial [Thermoleophilaceae bacterium]
PNRTEHATRGGTSMRLALMLAGVDPQHVDSLAIRRPNGNGAVTLSGDEIRNGFDGDPLGAREATFDASYNAGTEVHFFRPLRMLPGGEQDRNGGDQLDPPTGSDLVTTFHTDGPLLRISAHADPTTVDKGSPIGFSASATGGSGTPRLTWDFGDPSPGAEGDSVQHSYGREGSYSVTVTAVTPDGGSGVRVLSVQVGRDDANGGPDGGGSGPSGSEAPTGGGSGGPSAPSSGPRQGARGHENGQDHRGRGEGRATPRAGGSSPGTGSATPSSEAAPTSPRDSFQPPPSRPGPSRGGPAAARGDRALPQRQGSTSLPRNPEPVSGVLLASAGSLPDAAVRRALSGRAGGTPLAVRAAADEHADDGPLAVGVALALLLVLGAARELGVRPFGRIRTS